MGSNRTLWMALLALAAIAALLYVVILDPGGWGGFLREWAVTLIPQTAVAVLVWCVAVMALHLLHRAGQRPPPWLLYLLFPLAALASLWALRAIYGWKPDLYDYLWAALMVAIFYLLGAPMAFLRREFASPLGRPASAASPPVRPSVPPAAAILDDTRLSPPARGAFRQLLGLVQGDRAVARRLVLHERDKDPYGSDVDWVEAAITKLLDDRR